MTFDPVRLLRESVRANMATAIERNWRKQNEVSDRFPVPKNPEIQFNLATFQNIADDVARNAAQAMMEIVEMAKMNCQDRHDQRRNGKGCCQDFCPFFIHPEDA